MPTITFTVSWTYQLNSNGTSSGVLTVTGTTNYAADGILLSNVVETVTVTDPSGMIHTITINPATSRSGSMSIPQDSTGNVMKGEYAIGMQSVVSGPTLPGTYDSAEGSYDYCPVDLNPELTATVSCMCAYVKFTDETSWATNGYTVVSRTITLTPPVYPGIWAAFSTTSSSITTEGKDLYTGTYTAIMALVVSKDGVTYTFSVRATATAECATVCEMQCALNSLYGKITSSNNASLAAQMQSAFNFATALLYMADQAQSCNQSQFDTYVSGFWNALKPFGINQDCDCDCCEGTDVIQARCGQSGSGSSLTFEAFPPQYLTRTVVGDVVTYSLTAAAIALLDAVLVYDFTSTDNTVSITSSGGASPGSTKTFDLKVAAPARNTMVFNYTESFVSSTSSFGNLSRKGSIWTNTTPSVANVMVTWLSVMEISNFVTSGQRLFIDAKIIAQQPSKAFEPPVGHMAEIVRCEVYVNSTSTATSFQVLFYDLAATDPIYRDIPIPYNGLSRYLNSITIQFEITV